jgi:hypothetical protein
MTYSMVSYFTSKGRKICGMAIEPLPISSISCYIAVWEWEPRGQAQGNAFPEAYQIKAFQPFASRI